MKPFDVICNKIAVVSLSPVVLAIVFLFVCVFLSISGCDIDDSTTTAIVPPILPGACEPAPVPSASVSDILLGDGLGNVQATDTTAGAISWDWTLVNCQPDGGSSSSLPSTCPLGAIRWTLTVCNSSCCDTTGNTITVS